MTTMQYVTICVGILSIVILLSGIEHWLRKIYWLLEK